MFFELKKPLIPDNYFLKPHSCYFGLRADLDQIICTANTTYCKYNQFSLQNTCAVERLGAILHPVTQRLGNTLWRSYLTVQMSPLKTFAAKVFKSRVATGIHFMDSFWFRLFLYTCCNYKEKENLLQNTLNTQYGKKSLKSQIIFIPSPLLMDIGKEE